MSHVRGIKRCERDETTNLVMGKTSRERFPNEYTATLKLCWDVDTVGEIRGGSSDMKTNVSLDPGLKVESSAFGNKEPFTTADLKKQMGILEEQLRFIDSTFRTIGPDLDRLRMVVAALHKAVLNRERERSNGQAGGVKIGHGDGALELPSGERKPGSLKSISNRCSKFLEL